LLYLPCLCKSCLTHVWIHQPPFSQAFKEFQLDRNKALYLTMTFPTSLTPVASSLSLCSFVNYARDSYFFTEVNFILLYFPVLLCFYVPVLVLCKRKY
jgi:hypothetical protein